MFIEINLFEVKNHILKYARYKLRLVLGAIRTHDLLLRRQPLYPAELRGQKESIMVFIDALERRSRFWSCTSIIAFFVSVIL